MSDKRPIELVPAAKKTRAEEILSRTEVFDFDEFEIIRLGGGSAANGDKNDPVVFQGRSERLMRQMIAKYGFDRMPLTYGEFQGLSEYCSYLDVLVGEDIVKPERREDWIKTNKYMWAKYVPKHKEAGPLYAANDLDGLKKYHSQNDVLTKLGQAFDEFADE